MITNRTIGLDSNVLVYCHSNVASALEANCHIFYSEDLHHGLVVENRMEIINPFI